MFRYWQQGMLFNTTQIEARAPQGEAWTGTGFFLHFERAGKRYLFLVTNQHVIEDSKASYFITIHRRTQAGTGIQIATKSGGYWIDPKNPIRVQLPTQGRTYPHPDSNLDLACVECSHLTLIQDALLVPMTQSKLLDWQGPEPYPSMPLMFVGYPDELIDPLHNLPVVRTGTMASMPTLDFDGRPIFLIDAQVWPGSSGSPVFVTTHDQSFALAGVIYATRPLLDDPEKYIGIGYAIKSSAIAEMLMAITAPKV